MSENVVNDLDGAQELAQRDAAQAQLDRARVALKQAQDKTADFVRLHPGVCIGGALLAGYLMGRVAAKRWLR
jgi:ElaB/YqjD/DUF883 family membrane-anchored ribosome-binding protein